MNRLWSILLLLLLAACNATEEINTKQRADIASFLGSKHNPKLLSESEVAESLVENPEFYFQAGHTTFMYIQDYYNADRDLQPEIKKGSRIKINFMMFDFTTPAIPTISTLLYTNDPSLSVTLEEMGLNPQYWRFEPYALTVGQGALFGRIESMLVGCHQGDIIEFYMTLDEAYGQSIIGLSTVESPLAFFCEILEVEN